MTMNCGPVAAEGDGEQGKLVRLHGRRECVFCELMVGEKALRGDIRGSRPWPFFAQGLQFLRGSLGKGRHFA